MVYILNKLYRSCFLFLLLLSLNGCIALGIATTATTGAMVADERTFGSIVDDKVITTKVKYELVKNSTEGNSLKAVSVDVYEGRVLLTGHVPNAESKDEAEKVAWLVRGVKEVINDSTISKKGELNGAKDLWITTKIKTQLLMAKEIRSVNYKVVVYDGIVYLLGIAGSQDEIDIALQIASEVKGVSKVKNYIVVKTDARRAD